MDQQSLALPTGSVTSFLFQAVNFTQEKFFSLPGEILKSGQAGADGNDNIQLLTYQSLISFTDKKILFQVPDMK
jgi:hypothetical protein